MRLTKDVTFTFRGVKKLRGEDSIEQLTELLIELCQSGVEIIDAYDARRYKYLLRELAAFPLPEHLQADFRTDRAGAVRISLLPAIVPTWLMSHSMRESRLMSYHLMDTANFIEKVICGCRSNSPYFWRLKPLDETLFPHRLMIDATLKREFTTMNRIMVMACVPEGTKVVDPYRGPGKQSDRVVFAPGQTFKFAIERCHLSQAVGEYCYLKIVPDQSAERTDLCQNFELPGVILPCETVQEQGRIWTESLSFFRLPPRWITHEILHDENGRLSELVSAPAWDLAE